MEYVYIMGFISWMIMILMLTGYMIVNIAEHSLKGEELSDEQRMNFEAFVIQFLDSSFVGRVNFITLQGARFWAIVLGDTFKRKG